MALAVVAVFVGACSDSDDAPAATATAASTVTATSEPTVTPTPEPAIDLLGLRVVDLRIVDPKPLPEDAVLYLISDCQGCANPVDRLYRAYRSPAGSVQEDTLLEKEELLSALFASTQNQFVATYCAAGDCGGVAPPTRNAKSVFTWSGDGGTTWHQGEQASGAAYVLWNTSGPGQPYGTYKLVRDTGATFPVAFYRFPGNFPEPADFRGQEPRLAKVLSFSSWVLVPDSDGTRFYHADSQLNPNVAFDFSFLPTRSRVFDIRFARQRSELMISWNLDCRIFTGFADRNGEDFEFHNIFRWPAGTVPKFTDSPDESFLSGTHLVVTIVDAHPGRPAIVDLESGEIAPVTELVEATGDPTLRVTAAVSGPFGVVTGNECAPLLASMEAAGRELTCIEAGTLIPILGVVFGQAGESWVSAHIADKGTGWVRADDLEFGNAPSLNWYPADFRTGNPEIDPVLAAIQASNEIPQDLIAWTDTQCGIEQPLGYTQYCPDGVPAGSTIGAIRVASCEGGLIFQTPDGAPVDIGAGPYLRLHSIAEATPDWFGGDYVLVYVRPENPAFAQAVYVTDGKIAGRWAGCGSYPDEILERAGPVILSPP